MFWFLKRLHTFPKDICPKVNVISWLEFELAYFKAAVQHLILHYFVLFWFYKPVALKIDPLMIVNWFSVFNKNPKMKVTFQENWHGRLLIDSNGMLTCLELFQALRLNHYIYCTFIFTILCCCSIKVFFFCTLSYQIWIIFKQIYFTDFIGGTQAGITTLCQSGSGSNSNEEILHSP